MVGSELTLSTLINPTSVLTTHASEKICVLFGTSISDCVDGIKMSKKNRTVVNVATSGAYIEDIRLISLMTFTSRTFAIHKMYIHERTEERTRDLQAK